MEIPGFVEPDELSWLHERASGMDTVLEIGVWMGRSTSALCASGCPTVYGVDHFQGSPSELDAAHGEALHKDIYTEAMDNLAGHDNLKVLRMSSLAASRLFLDESIDMVFIDGEHTTAAVLTDLLAWTPKVRRLLCGHDVNWEGVAAALVAYDLPFQLGPGSLWYMEKI